MVNALLAGSVVAVMAGLVGWLMVLRREAFAGHTLSMMAFPGASAAALAGVPAAWGYFAFCSAGALAIGRLPGARRRLLERASPPAIGAIQALALAVGFLFVSLYGGVLGDLESLLFGNLLGVCDGAGAAARAVVAARTLAALAALGRPLLFASVDADVAAARGVPVRAAVAGVPAAARPGGRRDEPGHRRAARVRAARRAGGERAGADRAPAGEPRADASCSGCSSSGWGSGIAYFSVYPAGFFVASVAFAVYVLARVAARARSPARGDARARQRTGAPAPPSGCSPDALAGIHAQRAARRHVRRAGVRRGGLVRRAARPGVRGRRAQPRRVPGRARRGGRRRSTSASGCSPRRSPPARRSARSDAARSRGAARATALRRRRDDTAIGTRLHVHPRARRVLPDARSA